MMALHLAAAALVALASPALATSQCGMAGGAPWVGEGCGKNCDMKVGLFPMLPDGPDGDFNMSIHVRHGPTGAVGKVLPGGKVQLTIMKGNATIGSCEGALTASCNNVTWTSGESKGKSGGSCFGAQSWCRAWTPGCDSPVPPYGEGFSFLSSLGSNMVLQQAPAKSAVYGIVIGNPSAVKVTVTDEAKGTSYEVDAEFNTTHQPFGPAYVGGEAD